jgi:hypothetical protein
MHCSPMTVGEPCFWRPPGLSVGRWRLGTGWIAVNAHPPVVAGGQRQVIGSPTAVGSCPAGCWSTGGPLTTLGSVSLDARCCVYPPSPLPKVRSSLKCFPREPRAIIVLQPRHSLSEMECLPYTCPVCGLHAKSIISRPRGLRAQRLP